VTEIKDMRKIFPVTLLNLDPQFFR
jgi:hypothetical protein